jgi:hypothetical protein
LTGPGIFIGAWLGLLVFGVLNLGRAVGHALATLRVRHPGVWQELGAYESPWDLVWRDSGPRRFPRFVSERRYDSMDDRELSAAFAGFVASRNRWIVIWTASSIALMVVLKFAD